MVNIAPAHPVHGDCQRPDVTSSSALAAGNVPAPGVTIGFGRRGSNTAPGSPF
jgi:hypothetical protein